MALASLSVVLLGTFAFFIFWVLAVFPSFKLLPIGRTAGALAGAVLTVVFCVESPTEAYAAVDLSILGLLFGTMVVGAYLEKADMFKYLGDLLSWKSQGGKDLLIRVCLLSAVSSALFTNDTCCLVLTEFVLRLCAEKHLPAEPFLIALASSANIGSVATPIGNPQNLVIAIESGISFRRFLMGLIGATVFGIALNILLLLLLYWRQLSPIADERLRIGSRTSSKSKLPTASPWTPFHSGNLENPREILESLGVDPDGFDSPEDEIEYLKEKLLAHKKEIESPSSNANPNELESQSITPLHDNNGDYTLLEARSVQNLNAEHSWKKNLWKSTVYFVAVAMLAALLYGFDLSWTALTAAVTLMAIDFCDAGPTLEKVSYPLLVFFAGMFIAVDGFNQTGIPGTFWDLVEPYSRINDFSSQIVLALVVIVLSNVASNVPTVLLLGTRVADSALSSGASATSAWLILAWTSTLAGNLTLVGSAANLIVSEQARKAKDHSYDLTFFPHLKFGFPSTLIITILGLPLIWG